MYCNLFIHLHVDGHLSCFQFKVSINNAVMNISVQTFVLPYVFILLSDCIGVELKGCMVKSGFNFLKNSPFLQNDCTPLHSC